MKTGRELDAEIARRIMGWTNVEPDCYTPIGKEWCGDDPEGTGGFNRTGRKIIPRYPESIEEAMQVVEKMRERGCWTHIRTFTHTTQVQVEMGVPSSECQEWGDTMPEAICKCSMKAIEKFGLAAV